MQIDKHSSSAVKNEKLRGIDGSPLSLPGFAADRCVVNGLKTYFLEGPKNGPPLLLISGLNELWQNYLPVLEPLSKNFHVFLAELRGHGQTDWSPERAYRVLDYASDAEQFIAQIIGKPCYVAGHSLGALVAVYLGAYAPARVKAISLEDPPLLITEWATFGAPDHWIRRSFLLLYEAMSAARAEHWSLERFTDALYSTVPLRVNPQPGRIEKRVIGLGKVLAKLRCYGVLPNKEDDAYQAFESGCERILRGELVPLSSMSAPRSIAEKIAMTFLQMDPATLQTACLPAFSEGFDQKEALAKVETRMLFLQADPDFIGFLNEDELRTLHELAGERLEFHVIESAGHHIHVDESALFIDKLNRFFLG